MKQMMNKFSILIMALIGSVGVISACGQSRQSTNKPNFNQPPSIQTQTSEIPSGVKNPTYDSDVNKASPLFIKVAADNKIYLRKFVNSEFKDGKLINFFDYTPLTEANLIGEITTVLQDKTPDTRWAYIQADPTVKFGKLTEFFEKLAKNDIEPNKVQLVVNPLKEVDTSQQTESGGYVLTLILPEKIDRLKADEQKSGGTGNGRATAPPPLPLPPGYKPKPKTAEQIAAEGKAKQIELEKAEARKKIKVEKLFVEFDDTGKIQFNKKLQTTAEFSANLKKIFDERTGYDIFRPGTKEVDNTVYLKISPNANYGAAIKLIDEIYGLGAKGIYLDGSPNK